jgi:hypothetical protein
MARSPILFFLFFAALVSFTGAYGIARRVEQSLVDRATSLGGWPLAAVPCPADAPVICSTGISSQINQQCCPNGTTCFSWPSIYPVCCSSCKCLLQTFKDLSSLSLQILKILLCASSGLQWTVRKCPRVRK